jgi:preprotein translocase subunit YajC
MATGRAAKTREVREVLTALPFFRPSRTNAVAAIVAGRRGVKPLARNAAADHFEVVPMLISPAYAQTTGLMDQSALVQFLPLVLIFVVFYFLLIRPQQKKQKDHRTMLEALRRGDRVVTGGGIVATVNRVVSAEEVEVDISSGVRVRLVRSTIASVLAKPDPAAAREAARDRDRDAAKGAKEKEPVKREADKV